jgi:hypothetical protein
LPLRILSAAQKRNFSNKFEISRNTCRSSSRDSHGHQVRVVGFLLIAASIEIFGLGLNVGFFGALATGCSGL